MEDELQSGTRGRGLKSGGDGRQGEVGGVTGGVGVRRDGGDETAAAGRGDEGGDVVPWSPVLAVNPGVGGPASRSQ